MHQLPIPGEESKHVCVLVSKSTRRTQRNRVPDGKNTLLTQNNRKEMEQDQLWSWGWVSHSRPVSLSSQRGATIPHTPLWCPLHTEDKYNRCQRTCRLETKEHPRHLKQGKLFPPKVTGRQALYLLVRKSSRPRGTCPYSATWGWEDHTQEKSFPGGHLGQEAALLMTAAVREALSTPFHPSRAQCPSVREEEKSCSTCT